MARIPQGILGGLSGKIGGVVGSSWKGINVLKTKPLSVANPRTAAQQLQRAKFANCVQYAVVILSTILKPLWDRFAGQMSGYNAFVKENVSLFASLPLVHPESLITSKGKMAATEITVAEADVAGNVISLEWNDDSGSGYKLSSDIAYLVIIDNTDNKIAGFNTTRTRSDLTAEVTFVDNIVAGHEYECYLTFKRTDGTVVSVNSYKEAIGA